MRRRDRRLLLIGAIGAALLGAVGLASVALRDTAAYFYSPTQAKTAELTPGVAGRVGGLVAEGSVARREGGRVDFVVTDRAADLRVTYVGVLPDLFREGQGVIAEGRFAADGTFKADRILAKHDESYMPKEVAEALKASGEWRPAPDAAGVDAGKAVVGRNAT